MVHRRSGRVPKRYRCVRPRDDWRNRHWSRRRRNARGEALATLLAEHEVARVVSPASRADQATEWDTLAHLPVKRGASDGSLRRPRTGGRFASASARFALERVAFFEREIDPDQLSEPRLVLGPRRIEEAAEREDAVREGRRRRPCVARSATRRRGRWTHRARTCRSPTRSRSASRSPPWSRTGTCRGRC